jgi:chromosome segregation ATPase
MGTIEEAHPRVPDSVVISQLRQTLDEKDKQLQCKDQQLKAKDQQLQAKNQQLQAKDLQLQAKDDKVKRFILELGQQCEEIKLRQQQRWQHLQESTALKTERDHYYEEIEQLQCRLGELEEELRQQPPVVKKVSI